MKLSSIQIGIFALTFFLIPELSLSAPIGHGDLGIRILSYNVHGLPDPFVADHGQYETIGNILAKRRAEGTAPHVVVIQEGFRKVTRKLIRNAGYPYVAQGPGSAFLKFSSGLWVMSEYPILDVHRTVYDRCMSWDCFAKKGVVHVRVQVPGSEFPVDIYDTHMNSDPDSDPFATESGAHRVRTKQVQQMEMFIAKTKAPDGVVLVGGDFNYISTFQEALLFTFLTNLKNVRDDCKETQNCTGNENYTTEAKTAIDHQYFQTNLSGVSVAATHYERTFKETVQGELLSDHFGLEAGFRIYW